MFTFSKAAMQFSALADESRLKLYTMIVIESGKCDMDETDPVAMNTVTGLTALSALAQSTVSHHIKRLHNTGLVESKRKHNKKYLFPTPAAIEYQQHISSLFQDALANDKTYYSDVAERFVFEQDDYSELIDFLTLHNFTVQGPTSLESSYGAIRYHIYNPKRRDAISIELTYTPVDGSLHLGYLERFSDTLKDDIETLKSKISHFASAKAKTEL